nr:MAG TPA: hypothetical protein [Caudoviricetes sp.]
MRRVVSKKKKNADLRHRHRTSIRCIAAFLFH